MATQHPSAASRIPALSHPYPMANPGYGKRSVPGQPASSAGDFAFLPDRERYIAGFIDHLPDGASMDVKSLAKQVPLYAQQAVGSALRALTVAGHLRRARCQVGDGDQVRWVFRTFWSRTARDNEWWISHLAAEGRKASPAAVTSPPPPARVPVEEPAPVEGPLPVAAPLVEEPLPVAAPLVEGPVPVAALLAEGPLPVAVPPVAVPPAIVPSAVPQQRGPEPMAPPVPESAPEAVPGPASGPTSAPAPGPDAPSPAYLALARLGRTDARLVLSAADCAALEERAAEWLARGVDTAYLTRALTAGLPPQVDSPVGFLRRRLRDKIPPLVPPAAAPPAPGTPVRLVMVECAECGAPGRPEALPDGLCLPCHRSGTPEPVAPPAGGLAEAEVRSRAGQVRELLRAR
ncbi:MarR family transcriptional regulator [Streptomyces nitrosporeus]|uniref:MarR family transcriptional regulator n=1 Tax=Streptomyces nitrosporeus TaxID=28894 RepID=UPI0039A3F550